MNFKYFIFNKKVKFIALYNTKFFKRQIDVEDLSLILTAIFRFAVTEANASVGFVNVLSWHRGTLDEIACPTPIAQSIAQSTARTNSAHCSHRALSANTETNQTAQCVTPT